MDIPAIHKFKRVSEYRRITGGFPDFEESQFLTIKGRINSYFLKSGLVLINWVVLRRIYFPQFGILIHGFLHSVAIDLLPSLIYLNYNLYFRLSDYSSILNHMDPLNMDQNPYWSDSYEKACIRQNENNLKRKYYSNTQYWH